MRKGAILFVGFALSGCCGADQLAMPPGTADATQVVNTLKEELSLFGEFPPTEMRGQSDLAVCTGVDGHPIISIEPTKAELTLKVVTTNSYGANVSAKIPVGSVVTVDPSFGGSYQTGGTQALTLTLDIKHSESVAELEGRIDSLQKEVERLSTLVKNAVGPGPKNAFGDALIGKQAELALAQTKLSILLAPMTPSERAFAVQIASYVKSINGYKKLQTKYAKSNKRLAAKYAKLVADAQRDLLIAQTSLAHLIADPIGAPVSDVNKEPIPSPLDIPVKLRGHTLASTLWTMRQELLNVDHAKQPCVKPSQLVSQIDFEVVTDKSAKFGIDIYIVSVGASADVKKDSIQSLKVTFDMGSSSSFLAVD